MRIQKNCYKKAPFAQEYLLNCFIVFLSYYSLKISRKAYGLLFIFVRICMDHVHFSTDKRCTSCEPHRPIWVFFSCEMAVNTARKACFEVCGVSLHTVFNPERNLPLSKSPPVCKCNTAFVQPLFLKLMVCSRGCGKANKYTYKQTYIHLLENNFKKPGAPPR